MYWWLLRKAYLEIKAVEELAASQTWRGGVNYFLLGVLSFKDCINRAVPTGEIHTVPKFKL
jgi:hypothetical protein